jgi:hypothetical protein
MAPQVMKNPSMSATRMARVSPASADCSSPTSMSHISPPRIISSQRRPAGSGLAITRDSENRDAHKAARTNASSDVADFARELAHQSMARFRPPLAV